MIEVIETTVWTIGGTRVAIGNIFEQQYRTADGAIRTGYAAVVHVVTGQGADKIVAGAGSHLTINGERWEVVRVEPGPENRGSIVFRPLHLGQGVEHGGGAGDVVG